MPREDVLIVMEMTKRTEKEFEALEKEARKLGKKTKRSCSEAHAAMRMMPAKLGMPLTGSEKR